MNAFENDFDSVSKPTLSLTQVRQYLFLMSFKQNAINWV